MFSQITNIITSITSSITTILLGFLMFIASFFVIFFNEGGENISDIVQDSIELDVSNINNLETNKAFVSLTAKLESNEKIGDLFLKKGNYLLVNRIVETYKTEIDEDEDENKHDEIDEYKINNRIKNKWIKNSEDINNLKNYYQKKELNSTTQIAKNISITEYSINTENLDLPKAIDLILTEKNIKQTDSIILLNKKYLFKGLGTLQNPKIGDIRIHYEVIKSPSELVTIFGEIDRNNKTIFSYYDASSDKNIYKILRGDRNIAIETLKDEDIAVSWIFRFLGFAIMWGGLLVLVSPITRILEVIPFVGSFGSIGIMIITGILSLILSIISILLSIILHNIIILISFIIIAIILFTLYIRKNNDTSRKNLIA